MPYLEIVPVVSQVDSAEGADREYRRKNAGEKIVAPVPAKVPSLKRTPPRYKPMDDEYNGLVWDAAYVRQELDARGNQRPYEWRRSKWNTKYLLIRRVKKNGFTFWAAPIAKDGTLGKMTTVSIYDGRDALSLCRNLSEHMAAQATPMRAGDI